jgi:hypothetical protein
VTLVTLPRLATPRPSVLLLTALLVVVALAIATHGLVRSSLSATSAPCPTVGLTAIVRVGNSGGGGVAFHRNPDLDPGSRELTYPEDTWLRVIAAPLVDEGVTFARVRASDGVEGYLPVRYLVPEPASGCFPASARNAAAG